MLKRFSRWGLLLVATMMLGVLLAACGDATTPTTTSGDANQNQGAKAAAGYTSPIAANFPSTTSFYLTLNTNGGSDQIKGWQNIVKYLSNIPEVKTVFQNADLLALAKIGTYDGDVAPWIGDEVALGLTDVNAVANLATGTGNTPSEIPVLLATSVKDQTKAEAFVTKVFGQLKQASMPEPKLETYKDAKLWTVNAGLFSLVVGLNKNRMFIGGGPTLVKAAFDQAEGSSLSSVAGYKQVTGKLPAGDLAFVYADYQGIVKTLVNNPQVKSALTGLNTSNLGYTGSLGLSFATADQGFRVDAYQTYLPDKTPSDVAKVLAKGPNPNKILSALPESTILFANSRDAASAYNLLINNLKSMGGTTGEQVDKGLSDFEQQTGLSVQNDIVSLFQGEFAAFVTPAPANKGFPVGIGLVADASDKAAAQTKLDKIANAVETGSKGQIKFVNKSSGSTSYRNFTQTTNGMTISLNLGIVGNYAFITIGDDATSALISSATGGKNLTNGANAETFNKVKGLLPASNQGYAYVDTQALLKLVSTSLPATQTTQLKNYTDKLGQLGPIAASGTQSATEAYSEIYIYLPVTK